jgi:phenylpropionate dioxygenase-like ring-hydroxylating dioxygenase large terminal subunit
MSEALEDLIKPDSVREDFVPKEAYISPDWVKLEAEHLWPRVWQIACRLEEIPNPGDFVTYDIANDSIIVVRTSSVSIRAYYNVCPHRGRRLTEGCGHVSGFQCRFHGWRWNLEGENQLVLDRKDWGACLSDDDIRLGQVRLATWAGWVFINMDDDAEPLEKFLAPIPETLKNFEFEKLRFRWYKSVRLPCNWKTTIEAFNEAYHVAQTHPQLLAYINDYTNSAAHGRHGTFWYTNEMSMYQSPRLNKTPPTDYRQLILEYVEEFDKNLAALVTPRRYAAAQRLRTEVSADASPTEVLTKWAAWTREAAEAEGAGWPPVTLEDMKKSNVDWHIFPNSVFLHRTIDGVLWYRARPDGANPDSSIFDVWSLVRYAPGAEPPLKREFYADWRDYDGWGRILRQDFQNLEQVQSGMKVRGFKGLRPNPVQEIPITNFHRALREFITEGVAASRDRAKMQTSNEGSQLPGGKRE